MDKNNNSTEGLLGGFETILDDMIHRDDHDISPVVLDDNSDDLTDEEIEELKNKRAKSVKDVLGDAAVADKSKDKKTEDDDDDADDDAKKEDAKDSKKKEDSTKEVEETEEDTDDDSEEDSNQITNLFEAIAEQLGLIVDEDDEEHKKPTTVESLVTYFKEVIEENSVPTYASDEVMELDEYVRNGGKLTDFINAVAEIDYSTLDITDEDNQKRVVTAILREKGWSADKIDKKITRYEDAGALEDEAEEAIELLKGIATEKKEALLEDQKKKAAESKERQQKFYTDVVNEIKGLSDIRGIKIAKEDRSKLADYLLKPDANGVTQYQKDYSKGGVRNLLESAYFTMKGDVLINSAKSEGNSTAMQKLKNSLKTTGAGKSTRRVNSGTAEPIWVSVAQQLNNK